MESYLALINIARASGLANAQSEAEDTNPDWRPRLMGMPIGAAVGESETLLCFFNFEWPTKVPSG